MGTVEKRNKHKKRRFVSPEEKLERELKDCMHCRFFWGHNNRCANGTCCKPSKKKEQKLPTECVGCPYYHGNSYCFPLELMDPDDRAEALEEAGLDPDDYDFD